ncbi:MAG: ATP-binding protein, partial [Candidatus Sericytochromatia bacterium]
QPDQPVAEPVEVVDPSGLNEFELHLLEEAVRRQLNPIWLRFRVNRQVQLQPARISLIFNQLEAHGEVIKTVPPVPDLEAENFDQQFELLVISPESPEALRKHLLDEADVQSWLNLEAHLYGQEQPSPMLPLPVVPEAVPLRITTTSEVRESLMLPQPGELPESERLKSIRMQHLVRVDARQLDLLNELTGELLLVRARMSQAGSPKQLRQELSGLNHIMASLQAVSMKLQTVTAAHVFHRYPRMIRDLARSLSKEISCQLLGEQVEISRAYVDDLSSVLLHMIRNAADHGLETPGERLRLGKPRQGTIILSAAYYGQQVQIEVRDDGRGIDVEALKQKALNQQLMTREEIEALEPEASLQLIFSPGLSTSAAATDISGRGVGMDVVRNHIQQVGGTLRVESLPGQGTRFLISLPSAFRQVRSLLVRAEQQYYALPFEQVSKIRQGLEESAEGAIIALHSLSSQNGRHLLKPESVLLQIRNGDRPVWLIADELIGAQDLAIRQLANGTEEIVRGAAMLGAEDVALYLETEQLLKLADG